MSRKRGRPRRPYQIRVRAERRTSIDHEALARAVLEQAAMDEQARRARAPQPTPPKPTPTSRPGSSVKEVPDDELA